MSFLVRFQKSPLKNRIASAHCMQSQYGTGPPSRKFGRYKDPPAKKKTEFAHLHLHWSDFSEIQKIQCYIPKKKIPPYHGHKARKKAYIFHYISRFHHLFFVFRWFFFFPRDSVIISNARRHSPSRLSNSLRASPGMASQLPKFAVVSTPWGFFLRNLPEKRQESPEKKVFFLNSYFFGRYFWPYTQYEQKNM